MSSYIYVNGKYDRKQWWNDLVKTCAVIGEEFEIHCWHDEKDEIKLALRYGRKVNSSWTGGTVIRGTITRDFIDFLVRMDKPTDTAIYNKMTPFFSIFFDKRLNSEHYGTEMIIPKVPAEKKPQLTRILDAAESFAVVHRDIK